MSGENRSDRHKERVRKKIMELKKGKVWLLGAGPGDIGLLTCKAREVLGRAELVVFDALVSTEILALLPEQAEKINVGKRAGNHTMPQEEINQLLLQEAMKGKQVVRLKGGDPFVFGRGGEELELLAKEGIAFEVVPGVTSAVAVPAYAGIPVTHRGTASSFHVITGHAMQGRENRIDYSALVKMQETLVFLMGTASLKEICEGLLEAGMDREMPAAVIAEGTTAGQKTVLAPVSTLAEYAERARIKTPAMIVIGKVCRMAESYGWVEKRLLNGKNILLTRPAGRISEMAEELRFLGAQVIEMPTIQIKKIKNNKRLKKVIEQICGTQEEEWLVFTSPSGVMIFFQQLREWKIDLRRIFSNQIKIAVIGSGTARELEGYGIFADFMPEEYSAAALGTLLAQTVGRQKAGKKLHIIRAKEGSQDLIKPLLEAGIVYEDIPLYETVFVQNKILAERVKEMFQKGELDFAVFTSRSTVRGFLAAVELDKKEIASVEKFHAVCIGKETAKEAENQGMKVLMPARAEIDAMVDLIRNYSERTK